MFVSNCYKQWDTPMVHNGQDSMSFVLSREGVTQGDPLSMVTYGLGILPLIGHIKSIISPPHQPWYAKNAAIMKTWLLIVVYFDSLTIHRPQYGFFLEPEKLIVVVKEV